MIIHYEMLKRDQEKEKRRVLEFLNVEVDEKRLLCMRRETFQNWKRSKKRLKTSPYTEATSKKIYEVLESADKLLVQNEYQPLPLHLYFDE